MSEWRAFVEEMRATDPEFRKEYDKLGAVYGIIIDLIRIRTERGISQEELARRMGRQQPAISRFEGGNVTPSFRFLQDLADALDVELTIHLVPKPGAEEAPEVKSAASGSKKVARRRKAKVS
jgi:transcriptional regulator with XRE-family HTH domain